MSDINLRNEFSFEIDGEWFKANNVVLKKMKDCFLQGQAFGQYMFLGMNNNVAENSSVTQITGEFRCAETTITNYNFDASKGAIYVERMAEFFIGINDVFMEIAIGNKLDDPSSIVNYCSLRKIGGKVNGVNIGNTKFYCKTFLDVESDDFAFVGSDNNKLVKALLGVDPIASNAVFKIRTGKDYGEVTPNIDTIIFDEQPISCTVSKDVTNSTLILNCSFNVTDVQRLVLTIDGECVLVTNKGVSSSTTSMSFSSYPMTSSYNYTNFDNFVSINVISENIFARSVTSKILRTESNPFDGEINLNTKICKGGGRQRFVFLINDKVISAFYGVKEVSRIDCSPLNRYSGNIIDVKVLESDRILLVLDNETMFAGFSFDEDTFKFSEIKTVCVSSYSSKFETFFSGKYSTFAFGVFSEGNGLKTLQKLKINFDTTLNQFLITEENCSVKNVREYYSGFWGDEFFYKKDGDTVFSLFDGKGFAYVDEKIKNHLGTDYKLTFSGGILFVRLKSPPYSIVCREGTSWFYQFPFSEFNDIIFSSCGRYFYITKTDGSTEFWSVSLSGKFSKINHDFNFVKNIIRMDNINEKLLITFEDGEMVLFYFDCVGMEGGASAGTSNTVNSVTVKYEKKVYNLGSQKKLQLKLLL